jgi:hypothetical protein
VDRYRLENRPAHLLRYGLDPKVACLGRLGNTLWFLGRHEAATRARDAALALADEIGHPFSRGTALVFAAMLSLELRDVDGLREYASRLASKRTGQEGRQIQVAVAALEGYTEVLDGQDEAGIARIRRALDDPRGAEHAPGMHAIIVRLLLAACARAGDARAGLAAAERALEMGGASRAWEAEARRLRAEFLAALGAPAEETEAELERALRVARRQAARSLELRVAVSLLRHRTQRGDGPGTSTAYDLLAKLITGFAEERATPDLREAATILANR